jgi:hypothetical protein
VLVFVFGLLTTYRAAKTESIAGRGRAYHTDLAERASDALGNVPVIQSFTRIEASRGPAQHHRPAAGAQIPVLSWWAMAAVATRASATLTVTRDLPARHLAVSCRAWPRSARSSPSWASPPC